MKAESFRFGLSVLDFFDFLDFLAEMRFVLLFEGVSKQFSSEYAKFKKQGGGEREGRNWTRPNIGR
jgi:hypothetical protein